MSIMYKLIDTFNTLSQIHQPSHEGNVINLFTEKEVKSGDLSKVMSQRKAKTPTRSFKGPPSVTFHRLYIESSHK